MQVSTLEEKMILCSFRGWNLFQSVFGRKDASTLGENGLLATIRKTFRPTAICGTSKHTNVSDLY